MTPKQFLFRYMGWSVYIFGHMYLFRKNADKEFICVSWTEGRQAIKEGLIK